MEEGNIEYYECSICGETFLDAEGRQKVSKDDVRLEMAAHDFAYVSHTDTTHTYSCTVCGALKTEPHNATEVSGRNVGHFYKTACDCGHYYTYEEIPTISINTNSGEEIRGDMNSAEYYDCTVSVSDCDTEYVLTNETARVKVRGNYSANYEKSRIR